MNPYKEILRKFFSEYVSALRKRRGLTQEQMAEKLRITGRAYSDLERGIYCFSVKNTWKRVLKNNQSYLSDPEKQKVLRFAMQRPALYLNELEACMEQILAETLEEAEKTA